jgi:mono/diheme cytochrome c family protein
MSARFHAPGFNQRGGVWLAIAFAMALAAACQPSGPALVTATPPPPPDGQRLFRQNCAECHGARGQGRAMTTLGAPAPSLVSSEAALRLDVATISSTVRAGRGRMPPNLSLSDDELTAVAQWVQALQTADAAPATAPSHAGSDASDP